MSTVQELAEQMHSALERKERTSGQHDPGLSNIVALVLEALQELEEEAPA